MAVLDSFFFGFGRTLQEIFDRRSCKSFLRSIGYNMIEYLHARGIDIVDADPLVTLKNIANLYVKEGLAKDVHVKWKGGGEDIKFTIHSPIGSSGFAYLSEIYGRGIYLRPSPLFAMIFAALTKIGYDIKIVYMKQENNIWCIKAKINKMKFLN
jgi:hypothetical protein